MKLAQWHYSCLSSFFNVECSLFFIKSDDCLFFFSCALFYIEAIDSKVPCFSAEMRKSGGLKKETLKAETSRKSALKLHMLFSVLYSRIKSNIVFDHISLNPAEKTCMTENLLPFHPTDYSDSLTTAHP